MTVKEFYNWAVANNYENLPIAAPHLIDGEYDRDGFVTVNSIEMQTNFDNKEEETIVLFLTGENGNYIFG